MTKTLPPERVRFGDDAKTLLAVDWRDGHVSTYPLAYLRGWCPCAGCQGHGAVHSFHAGGAARLTSLRQVGAYALGLAFEDGHHDGIYTWERLREMCPCPACGGPLAGTPDGVVSA
jgi:DUF971 family protein